MKKIAALILCTLLLVGLCLALTACGECKHNYGEPTVTEPTCTEDGKYTYTCTKCGESMDVAPEADEVEMLKKGHSEDPDGVVTTAASCTTDGQRTYSCTVCEAELRTETIAAAGHAPDLGTVTTPPTCTEAGVKTFKCANYGCGETLSTEPIAALGHDVDADAFETDGTNHYNVCERTGCGAQLNTAACSFAIDAVDAEKHANICSVCAGQKGEAEAHTFGAEQTLAASTDTCASGKTYKVCTACTYENVIAIFPGALAHTYAFDAEATTMDEVEHADSTHGYVGGTLVYTCVGCDGS